MATIAVIGSGFSGMAAACYLAKEGHDVTILEKNDTIGGRARVMREGGFVFDMGPSWYWMPDVFEAFFASFGKRPGDYYDLVQLDPGFQMIFGKDDVVPLPANMKEVYSLFESIEPGSPARLRQYLDQARLKYNISMKGLVYNPCDSWLEFAKPEILANAAKMQMFTSVSSHVHKHFNDPRLIALMEFPVLFLGATAKKIPALYSMMNYAAIVQGTWYPKGGMFEIVSAMQRLAISLGVSIKTNTEVSQIIVKNARATALQTKEGFLDTDAVIAACDYHHTEQSLLEPAYRNYGPGYWDKKTFAPSCLIFYLGVNKRVNRLQHHNLFFDTDLDKHSREIYTDPQWPSEPLFYVCCPSKTDPTVAPGGHENLFILMPVATGVEDTPVLRGKYFDIIMNRLEALCGDTIRGHIVYNKSYCISDFVNDYNAYKGNAYGLANTLAQTAVLKPSIRNKAVGNLFYSGQLTVPGPGVPPALISGKIAAGQLLKTLKPTLQ